MKSHREDIILPSTAAVCSASKWNDPPYLAVLTEPNACDSIKRIEETYDAIERATCDGKVDLVVVRTDNAHERNANKLELLKRLSQLKLNRKAESNGFKLVINNDIDIAVKALSQNVPLDGMHVKERNVGSISTIRQQLEVAAASSGTNCTIIMGTSCHSIETAMQSCQSVDYLFVGTCYMTKSHPEKNQDQLEGPRFPGRIKEELNKFCNDRPSPIVFAIGGIDETNCHEPVSYGADGVGVIRSVMQADDPGAAACGICKSMSDARSRALNADVR